MGTPGATLQRSNLMGTNLIDSGVVNTSGVISAQSTTRYHYISCFSFNLLFKAWYQFFGSPHYTVRIHYWSGTVWVDAGGDNDVCYETIEWQINRPSGGYVNVVGPSYMWMVSVKHNSGVSGNTAREMRLWLHGIGEDSDAHWDTHVKGNKLACLSTAAMYSLGATASAAATSIPIFATSAQKSNPVSSGIAHNRFVPLLV